jgi:hypothetical protein
MDCPQVRRPPAHRIEYGHRKIERARTAVYHCYQLSAQMEHAAGGPAEVRMQRIAALAMFTSWLSACAGSGAPPESSPAHEAASNEHTVSAAPIASASEDPTAACAGVEPDGETFELAIETISYAFDTDLIEGPRHCQPFVITLTNNDLEKPPGDTNQHDLDIRAENVLGALLFDGELVNGGGSIRYEVPGLPAGEHYFYCSQHAGAMNGTLIVAEQ